MYYSLLTCLLEVFFRRKVYTTLKVKESMVKLEMINIASMQDMLHGYSGRHLQYAIKLGIMPTPERLSLILKRVSSAERALTARPLETRLMETPLIERRLN